MDTFDRQDNFWQHNGRMPVPSEGASLLRDYKHKWMFPPLEQSNGKMIAGGEQQVGGFYSDGSENIFVEEGRLLELNHLPNEVLSAVFKELTSSQAFVQRAVCGRWKECIETMYKPNRCLMFYFEEDHDDDDLARRNFAGDMKPFVKYQIKTVEWPLPDGCIYQNVLTHRFMDTMSKMFPNLEHLVIDTVIDTESVNAIMNVLPTWRQLVTLSLFRIEGLPETRKVALLDCLNHCICTGLTRLGIGELCRNWYCRLIFDNLQHFAYESSTTENSINEVIRRLTTNTHSLWARCYPLESQDVEKWGRLNRRFISNLEQLYIGRLVFVENELRAFVNVSAFTNIYWLRLEFESNECDVYNDTTWYPTLDPSTFATMAGLVHLDRLELSTFDLDLDAFKYTRLPALSPVTELTLKDFADTRKNFSGLLFCGIFCTLFPNLKKLYLHVHDAATGADVEAHAWQAFPKLIDFKSQVMERQKKRSSSCLEYYSPE